MNLYNIRQNLKATRMPIMRIVMACLMFVLISDKGLFNHILSNFNNIQFHNPESIVMSAVNISRIISLQYSIFLGIGYLFIELARFVAIAIAIFALIKHLISIERVEEKKLEVINSTLDHQTNDIYLKTSKFIC